MRKFPVPYITALTWAFRIFYEAWRLWVISVVRRFLMELSSATVAVSYVATVGLAGLRRRVEAEISRELWSDFSIDFLDRSAINIFCESSWHCFKLQSNLLNVDVANIAKVHEVNSSDSSLCLSRGGKTKAKKVLKKLTCDIVDDERRHNDCQYQKQSCHFRKLL